MAGRFITISLLLVSASVVFAAGGKDVVDTIDARSYSGRVVSITSKALLIRTTQSKTRSIAREQVAKISLVKLSDPQARPGLAILTTVSGDQVVVDSLRLGDGKFNFTNPMLGKVSVAMDHVSVVYQPAMGQLAADVKRKCREMKFFAEDQDMIVVKQKKDDKTKLLTVEGVLKSIGLWGKGRKRGVKITFSWDGKDRRISAGSVRAIMLAGAKRKIQKPVCVVVGKCGSQIGVSSLTLSGESFQVDIPTIGKRNIHRDLVASVRFSSARVVDLTSLKPASVKEYGFFDKTFKYRVDRAIGGGAIRLDGKIYKSGLALHSFCELTYRLAGKYSQFVALAGIDDSVRPSGDIELAFLGDGKIIGEAIRITGTDKSRIIRLKIAGVKNLTIRVSFGHDGLDIADHLTLANPKLIKIGNRQ